MPYQYQTVWKAVSQELAAEITAFWRQEKALPKGADPDGRAQQVVVVMRDADGAIAALSSAVPGVVPRLRQVLYSYRTLCAAGHRGNHTGFAMLQSSQNALLEYNQGLSKPEAIGIYMEIENRMIADHYNEAFWPRTGFSFIGYSPRGLVLRAYYFPGFKLQPPADAGPG
jgi:hypothetical protein